MGDLITEPVQGELYWVPEEEFKRVRRLNVDPVARTAIFATIARINTLYMIACAGSGHIGSSFSSMDAVSWLFLNHMHRTDDASGTDDLYFSSKGHDAPGLYAVLQGLGLLPMSGLDSLRRLGGLPGHPDIETPHIVANTGSLGMGISKAKGIVLADRLLGRERHIFVMTGDGELQEGQIWESLGSAANLGMSELTVLVDHNKIQSDTWVADVSDIGDLEAKFSAFGWTVARCDGHNLNAIEEKLEGLAKETDRPKVLILDTEKGHGVGFMRGPEALQAQPRLYRYHSGAPSAKEYRAAMAELLGTVNTALENEGTGPLRLESTERKATAAPSGGSPVRLVPAYGKALVEAGTRRPNLVVLDGDLALDTGLLDFEAKYPERFIECGIAEMDMVSMAGTLARFGTRPVCNSFASFLTPRAAEQIFNNASERARIVYTGVMAGVIPGGPGHSHQSVRDIALMSSVPEMICIEPHHERQMASALDWALDEALGATYLRVVNLPFELPFAPSEEALPPVGQGQILREGNDVAMIASSPVLLVEAWHASEKLAEKGILVRLIALPWLNRFDTAWLGEALAGIPVLVTLDNHLRTGGQGQMLVAALAEAGALPTQKVALLGLDDFPVCGTNEEVLEHHQMTAEELALRIRSLATS